MTEDTLYERLGERDAIAAVVDEFYDRVLADDALESYFEGSDPADLRRHQTQFLSHATGGPVTWDGDDMATAHEHLGVTPADFGRIADHLDDALQAFDVADADREAVLEAVGSYEEAIVTADD
ncbi:group 1 truncated hemoglobin [Halorubellus sp. PRR65]|uniref:group I truncated hemoglobin n=1 Tax=Halorubellus sp. PRR65 TaxID=3098148 RepID=UPI002B25DF13|nr:group 1 truncated hemoglobin [Halorubellus sp. PRR65]